MTEAQFRDSSANRQRLRELINDPVFAAASGIIVDEKLTVDARLDADALASVRLLSQRAGTEYAFQRLDDMCSPMPEKAEAARTDYGAAEAAANLEALEKGLPPPFNPT